MKKLTRFEMRDVKGGVSAPPPPGGGGTGGGGGGTGGGGTTAKDCLFISSACGNLCINISEPTGPLPPVSTCSAYLAYFNPTCHYSLGGSC